MDLTIRTAQTGDLAALGGLYRHLHPQDDPPPDERTLQQIWATMLEQPGFACVVGFHGDLLVSSCCVAVIPNLTRGGRPYALIENVVTHADFRRRGYGRAVLEHALRRAWTARCYKAMLLMGSSRPETRLFYEACGFSSGEKTAYVARPG